MIIKESNYCCMFTLASTHSFSWLLTLWAFGLLNVVREEERIVILRNSSPHFFDLQFPSFSLATRRQPSVFRSSERLICELWEMAQKRSLGQCQLKEFLPKHRILLVELYLSFSESISLMWSGMFLVLYASTFSMDAYFLKDEYH